jgi:hypothetical protein
MAKRITLNDVRSKVQNKRPFMTTNSTLFGSWYGDSSTDRYVVHSYGDHWPLFIYVKSIDRWFENTDKYGVTTSKHHGKAHPHTETTGLSCDDMRLLAIGGYKALAEKLVGR